MTFRRVTARVRQVEEPGRPSIAWAPPDRRGTHGPAQLTAEPKTVARRNPHLLAMARGRACLLQVADVCNGDRETTVACHSNLTEHEKGGYHGLQRTSVARSVYKKAINDTFNRIRSAHPSVKRVIEGENQTS